MFESRICSVCANETAYAEQILSFRETPQAKNPALQDSIFTLWASVFGSRNGGKYVTDS